MNTTEPNSIIQGETVQWEKEFCDYPPSEYTVTYYLRGPSGGIDILGTASGNKFEFKITSAQSAALAVGSYSYQAFAVSGDDKFLVSNGMLSVKKGLAAVGTGDAYDNRTQTEKDLEAVRAALSGKASNDVMSYTINNRQLARYSIPDLIALETRLAERVRQEKRAERLKKGEPFMKQILVRMKDD